MENLETRILTASELARALHCHKTTVCREAKAGRIPSQRVGRRYLFYAPAIEAWMQNGATQASSPPAERAEETLSEFQKQTARRLDQLIGGKK